jgi:predicted dehydrogenase
VPVRLGILGAVHSHLGGKLRAIARGVAGDVVVAGAFEADARVLARRRADPDFAGIRWVPRAEDILADDSVQGVIVDGEVWQFLDDARRALLAGKHVYLEKPAGLSLRAYRDVLDLAAARRLTVIMAYHFRHSPPFRLLFRLAREGALGDVFAVRGRIGKPKSGYDRWLEAMPYPGHIMFEMGGHLIDPMVALLGRPQRVTPFLRSDFRRPGEGPGPVQLLPRGVPGEDAGRPFVDNSLSVLEWEQAMGIVESAAMEVGATRRLEVLGTKGTFVVEPPGGAVARVCLEEAHGEIAAGWQVVDGGPWTPFAGDLRDLVGAVLGEPVRGERPPPFGPAHDFVVQETLLRASGVLDQAAAIGGAGHSAERVSGAPAAAQ